MYLLLSLLIPLLLLNGSDVHAQQVSIESHIYYPMMREGSGENGISQSDLTMQSGTPIDLAFSADNKTIWASSNISHFLSEQTNSSEWITLNISEDGHYHYQAGDSGNAGTIVIRLIPEDGFIQGYESIDYVLGDDSIQFRLAASESPDPRDLTDLQRCSADGAQIRLKIGSTVGIMNVPQTITLFEEIKPLSSLVANDVKMTVIAGPICVHDVAWWQVQLDDEYQSIAWIPEMTTGAPNYLVTELSQPDETPETCSSQLPSRLSRGAYVTQTPDATVFLYPSPNTHNHMDTKLLSNEIYQVISEPKCINDIIWWEIENDRHSGWMIEISASDYQIEPSHRVPLTPYLEELNFQG